MSNSRAKGARGERELANVLKEYGYDTHRGVQYQGGHESPDVVGLPGIHIECKRVERLVIEKAMAQAEKDCDRDHAFPSVFHRKNGQQWLVTMELDDWMKLYQGWVYGENLKRWEGEVAPPRQGQYKHLYPEEDMVE